MNFPFVKYSKVYYAISGLLILASIASLAVFGLKFGIEFTGGSNMEVAFNESRPSNEEISKKLEEFNLGEIVIQPTGDKGAVLQFKGVDEETHQKIFSSLNELSGAQEKSFQYIGPSVGQELKNKTLLAIVLALLAITLYIAFAFRKVSRPVASWKYGITSLVALFHDILIPLGVFSLLGHYYNVQITVPIVAAMLTIIGFSVHDTIVIFDRIRENILRTGNSSFEQTVDASLNQTFGRSLSTVATVLIVMFSLYFFGGETLKYFSLALIVGVAAGAYSSIFIAGPLLVTWHKSAENRLKKRG
ncbi:protein translocase subunit SecF [Candidatus Parcubacteria bacterium]|nr:protein translocase subunit SecF [Candidatus Parcubacteria bacterium]